METFQRRKRRLQARRSALARGRVRRPGAGLAARHDAARTSRRAGALRSSVAEAGEVARQPAAARLRPRAAQQRQFERLDGILERRWRAAEPATADASAAPAGSAAPVRLPRLPPQAARKCRPACPSARRRRNRRSRDSSGRAPPITRRASARSGVTSAADLSRCRASRIATAIASASISGLAASMTARLSMPPRDLLDDIGLRPAAGAIARSRSTAASPRRPAPRGRAARAAQDFDVAALDAEARQQRVHRELRMVGCRRRGEFPLRVPDAADRLPGVVVEIGIEPRQHHRALRQRARRRGGILRSPASIRSSPPRSPGRRDARVSRAASASIRRSRRAAGSILSISGKMRRPRPRARSCRNSSECCQYWSS